MTKSLNDNFFFRSDSDADFVHLVFLLSSISVILGRLGFMAYQPLLVI